MATALQAVRGMNDVLPDEAALWECFEDTARDVFRQYGYRNLRVPIVEPTPLFVRAIGEVTDIVEKEMYTFEDKLNGDSLTLRPEATAGIVRAAIEHNLTVRAAAARLDGGPDVPPRAAAEGPLPPVPPVRRRGARLRRARRRRRADRACSRDCGASSAWPTASRLEINSIGDAAGAHAHRAALVALFRAARRPRSTRIRKRRLHTNPLRILDSKNPAMQTADRGRAEADRPPRRRVARALRGRCRRCSPRPGIAFAINPRLVRGLDYYNRTVFEWVTDRLGAQGTVRGGGRYDGLFEQLGGKPTPGLRLRAWASSG